MKPIKKVYIKNSIIKFMLSYCGVLLIPLVICLLSYEIAFGIVKEGITTNYHSALQMKMNILEDDLRNINVLMIQAASNKTVISLADYVAPVTSSFYRSSINAVKQVGYSFQNLSETLVDDMYVYLNYSDYILTRYEMYNASFYSKYILKNDTITYEEWVSHLKDTSQYNQFVVDNGRITYYQKLPFAFNRAAKGVVVCNLNKWAIADYFSNLEADKGTILYIKDKNNNEILSISNEEQKIEDINIEGIESGMTHRINGKDYLIHNIHSDKTGWTYSLIIPENVAMEKLINLRKQMLAIFGIAFVLGIGVCYYKARKDGEPIERMKQNLAILFNDEEMAVVNDTSTLSGKIGKVVSSTESLKEEQDNQKPYLESLFLQKLIRGEFASVAEMKIVSQRADVNLSESNYMVVTCRIFGNNDMFELDPQTLEEASLMLVIIKDMVKQKFGEDVYITGLDQLTVVLVIDCGNRLQQGEALIKRIREISSYIEQEYKVRPFWGIGDQCVNLLDIWRTFGKAKSAMKFGIKQNGDNIITYNTMIQDEYDYYFPCSIQKRLTAYIKKADQEGCKQLCQLIYEENFQKKNLRDEEIERLKVDIYNWIVKYEMEGISGQEYVEVLKEAMEDYSQESIHTFFTTVEKVCIELSMGCKKYKMSQQSNLVDRIKEYISNVYSDSNLGLGMVSTEFNISEGYVSTLFKEQAGINYTDYVEELRISKACELLKQTDLSINEIGEEVGYNSVQSFRRAFKRIHGISPSALRK